MSARIASAYIDRVGPPRWAIKHQTNPKMLENLRSLFYKMDLSEKETRILSSVFASLAKKKPD